MSERVTCPFCGHDEAHGTLSQRMVCPRCGESFTPSHSASPSQSTDMEAVEPPTAKAFLVPGIVAAIMFIAVFTLGIKAILFPNKPTPPTTTEPTKQTVNSPATTMPPKALSGMMYLPPSSQVVVALQPAAFAEFSTREQKAPAELLSRYGVPTAILDVLPALKLKLEDVSQLLAGLSLPADGLFPRGVFVLILRTPPADEAALLNALKATPIPNSKRSKVTVRNLPLVMERPSATTFLFAFEADDLNLGIAAPGLDHFTPSLQASIGQVSPASFAWVALEESDWAKKPLVGLLIQQAKWEQLPDLATLRAAALGLSLEPKPTFTSAIKRSTTDWVKTTKPVE